MARPPGGDVLLVEAETQPAFVQDGTPFDIVFRLLGTAPEVAYVVGGDRSACTPSPAADGRVACRHPGLNRSTVNEGAVAIAIEATDGSGSVARAATSVVLDLTCPRALTANVRPSSAEPGQIVTVTIEASESLGEPPRVRRLGRDWGVPEGDGRRWTLERTISAADPARLAPVQVVLADRAGNLNTDCGQDVELPFSVDQRQPVIDVSRVLVRRAAPGSPTVVTASAAAFTDDVEVVAVRVYDESGATLAVLEPEPDGGLPVTSLGVQTQTRVLMEAVDAFGRSSGRLAVPERWRISLGTGSLPGVALRTGVRFKAPPPGTTSMRNLTVAGAPDVARADARSVVVRANVGFERVGTLPSFYEGVNQAYVGYDPVKKTIVAAAGYDGNDYRFFEQYVEDVLALSWDERDGEYVVERLDPISYTDPNTPPAGYGGSIAFDGQGCGLIYGGDQRVEVTRTFTTAEIWRICGTPGGYSWDRVPIPDNLNGVALNRFAPIIWDPANQRYVSVGGAFSEEAQVAFIEPPSDQNPDWRLRLATALPTAFGTRGSGYLFYDPRLRGFSYGLGGGSGDVGVQWSYVDGTWRGSQIPLALRFLFSFGSAFDTAREHLAVWGGNDRSDRPPRTSIWYMTGTATTGVAGWREAEIEIPVPRNYPSMVYDPDREVTVMFGGTWLDNSTARTIPAEIHQLISQPAFPYVQAEVELGAARPKGLDRMTLQLRASGVGDADGLGPGNATGGGVSVVLWDYELARWIVVAQERLSATAGMTDILVNIEERPERFIAPDGRLALAIRSSSPATEARSARLEVDLVDGQLSFRPGVTLP